ncbi:MAG TPA: hypothetical protein VGJ36_00590 [Gemmatimonadales bacterium]|jgi:uncharacterized protein YbaR (Trm112 family)
MFIELTDHLRCPVDHDESFLVLLPDRMEGRSVLSGQLGCPVCGRTFEIVDGVLDTGPAPDVIDSRGTALDADGLLALTGLHGPGGYLVLVGPVASLWREIGELNPGVALVGINPDRAVTDAPALSVLRGGRIPLKSRVMRGVVLGRPYADDPYWVGEAARVVLPGLRVVGEGADPPADTIDLMASAGGVWVGVKRR